jgi:hypothetical protein
MSIEERPRGHDEEECEGGSRKADVEGKLDVLEEETDNERDGLDRC